MPTGFYFDEQCLWHSAGSAVLTLPVGGWLQPMAAGGHAESPETKRRLKNLMDRSGLTAHLDVHGAAPASRDDLLAVHPTSYLDAFRQLSDTGGGALHPSAPFGAGSFGIACTSAGLAKAALDGVLDGRHRNAYALSRPPGHHCLRDTPMGFCLLANIPVAIEAARKKHGIEKVLVVDWDVHHGNGTQAIYYDDPSVHTVSIHQEFMFPPGYSGAEERGEGAGLNTNFNIPLIAGGGHTTYLETIERLVLPIAQACQPDVIIIACGFDPNHVDPLGRMSALSTTFAEMTRLMMEAADRLCEGRLLVVHEGGYSEAYVPFCGHALIEQLSGVSMGVTDPFLEKFLLQQPGKALNEAQSQRIGELVGHFRLG